MEETLPAVVRQIVNLLNAWADADLERLRRERDELAAQVLHHLPPVIPRPQHHRPTSPPTHRRGEGPRAMRQKGAPHPEDWGHGRE